MSHSPTLFSSDDECTTPYREKDLRKKLHTLLQGVPPPSSITISKFSAEEILFKYKENESTFNSSSNAENSFSSQHSYGLNKKLLKNNSNVSEDIASLSQKVQERYVQLETMSSCNIWFQSSIPLSGSAKKRSRAKQRIGLSPGRRLSHLARRKQIFSCANLQRMADMDKKRSIEIKKNGIYQDKGPIKSACREKLNMSKRALFLSPEDESNHSKHVKEFPKRKLFGSSEKKKKIPLKENSKRSEVRRWLFEQNFNSTEAVSKKRLRDENYDQVPERKSKCPRRSLTFQEEDELSRSPGMSSTHSSLSLPALSQNHKNKLLWAVSVALKEANITRKDGNFKKCASSLFMTCRKNLNKILGSQLESTSEKMLQFARQSIPSLLDKLGMRPNRNALTPVKRNRDEKISESPKIPEGGKENLDQSVQSDSGVVFKTPIKFIRVKKKSKTCDNKIRLKGVLVRCKSLESLENLGKKSPGKKIVKKLFDCDMNNSSVLHEEGVSNFEVTLLNDSDVNLASQTLAPSSVSEEMEGFSLLDALKKSEKNVENEDDDDSIVDSEDSNEICNQEFRANDEKADNTFEGPTRIEDSDEEEDLFQEVEKAKEEDGNDESVTFSLIYEQPEEIVKEEGEKPEIESQYSGRKLEVNLDELRKEEIVEEDGKSEEDELIVSEHEDADEEAYNVMSLNETKEAVIEKSEEVSVREEMEVAYEHEDIKEFESLISCNETKEVVDKDNDANDKATSKEDDECENMNLDEVKESVIEGTEKDTINVNETNGEAPEHEDAAESENFTTKEVIGEWESMISLDEIKEAVIEGAEHDIIFEGKEANEHEDTAECENLLSLTETKEAVTAEVSDSESIEVNDEIVKHEESKNVMSIHEIKETSHLEDNIIEENETDNKALCSPLATESDLFVAPEPPTEPNDSVLCDDSLLPSQTSTPILSPALKSKGRKLTVKKSKKNWKIVEDESDDDIPLANLRNLKLKVRLSHEWEVISKNYSTSDFENSTNISARQNNTEEQSTLDESEGSVDTSEARWKQLLEEKNFVEIEPGNNAEELNTSEESVDVENVSEAERTIDEDEIDVDPSHERLKQLLQEVNFVEIEPKPFIKEEEKTPEKDYADSASSVCEDQTPLKDIPLEKESLVYDAQAKQENVLQPIDDDTCLTPQEDIKETIVCDDQQKEASQSFSSTCSTVDHEALKELMRCDEPVRREVKEESIYTTPGKRPASPLLNSSHKKRVLSLENYKARKQLQKESIPDDLDGISPLKSDGSEETPQKKIYNIRLKRPEDRHKHKRKKEKSSHDRHKHNEHENKVEEINLEDESSEDAVTVPDEEVDCTKVQTMFNALIAISTLLEKQIKCTAENPGSVRQEDIQNNLVAITGLNDAIRKELDEWKKRPESAEIANKWHDVIATFYANNPILKPESVKRLKRLSDSGKAAVKEKQLSEVRKDEIMKCGVIGDQVQKDRVENVKLAHGSMMEPMALQQVQQPQTGRYVDSVASERTASKKVQMRHREVENVEHGSVTKQTRHQVQQPQTSKHAFAPKPMVNETQSQQIMRIHGVEVMEQTPPKEVLRVHPRQPARYVESAEREPQMEQTPPRQILQAQHQGRKHGAVENISRGATMEQTPPREVARVHPIQRTKHLDSIAHQSIMEQTPPREILRVQPLCKPVENVSMVQTPPRDVLLRHQSQAMRYENVAQQQTPPSQLLQINQPQIVPTNSLYRPYESTPPKPQIVLAPQPVILVQYAHNVSYQNEQTPPKQILHISQPPPLMSQPLKSPYSNSLHKQAVERWHEQNTSVHQPTSRRPLLQGNPGFANYNFPQKSYQNATPSSYTPSPVRPPPPPPPPQNPRKILSGTPGFSNFNHPQRYNSQESPREIYRNPHYPEFRSPDGNHFQYYNQPTYHSPDNYPYGREATTTTTSSSAFHSISPNGHYNSYSPWNSPSLVNNSNYHQRSPIVKPLRRSLVPQIHDPPYYGNC